MNKKDGKDTTYIYKTGRDPSITGVEAVSVISRRCPPICWGDGENITGTQMRQLGFKVEILYESTWLCNARSVEAQLQKMFHHLPLGRRLWKMIDMGAKNHQDLDDKRVYKVGITYHLGFKSLVDEGIVFVNHENIDIKEDHGVDFLSCGRDAMLKKALDLLDKEKDKGMKTMVSYLNKK